MMTNLLTRPHPYPGRLIVVEGIDGSGKSTQLQLLQKWLLNRNYRVFFTEWNQFRNLDLERLKGLLAAPRIVDCRNVYDPQRMRAAGFFVPALADHDARALALAGVTTHFANIEDTTSHAFAESQMAAFSRVADTIAGLHPVPFLRHNACSAAVLLFNRTHLDLVRVGISLYGLWPSKETYVSCLERGKPSLDLKPVMTWKTRIAQVKQVPEGEYVGYGCAWRATRTTKIAVLPVGYYEGYDRELSGLAHVLVRGKRAPLRGRVCMNMCMVDVTDIPGACLEDEVTLLGRQGLTWREIVRARLGLAEKARVADTTATALSARSACARATPAVSSITLSTPNPTSAMLTATGAPGPGGAGPSDDLEDAYRVCERIVRGHYENFPVASLLLPHRQRRYVAAVYAFARTADDFADEHMALLDSH